MSGAFHAFERRGWRDAARAYDASFGALTGQTALPMLDAAGVTAGTRLLDVACGPGDVCRVALERGAVVTALDFSPAMLEIARERAPAAAFHEGDAQALPFGGGAFDAVTSGFVLGHLTDPPRAVREARRVLRPAGRFATAWWRDADRAVAFGVVWRAVEAHGRTDVALPQGPAFDGFSEPVELKTLLEAAGFTDVRVEDHEFAWRMPSGESIFRAYLEGTVRTAGLLRAQTPEALETIRHAVIEGAETYRRGDGVEVPMTAMVVSGANP